jgi:hypothetical protein
MGNSTTHGAEEALLELTDIDITNHRSRNLNNLSKYKKQFLKMSSSNVSLNCKKPLSN